MVNPARVVGPPVFPAVVLPTVEDTGVVNMTDVASFWNIPALLGPLPLEPKNAAGKSSSCGWPAAFLSVVF